MRVEWDPTASNDNAWYTRHNQLILLPSEDGHESELINLHELGHHVMWSAYNSAQEPYPPGSCGGSHYIHNMSNNGCAWREGWANYFFIAVVDNPVFTHGVPNDLENRHLTFTAGQQSFDPGADVEGNVAALLWDIKDGIGEPQTAGDPPRDNVSGRESQMWNIFSRGEAADVIGFLTAWSNTYGNIDLSSIRALNEIPVAMPPPGNAPNTVGNVVTAPSPSSVSLSWSSPDDGGSAITGYDIQRRTVPGSSQFKDLATVGGSVTSYVDSTVQQGKTYDYKVRATNSYGSGPFSSVSTVSVPRPDTAPVISRISNQELPHTEMRTVRVTATDAENHRIVLSLVNPPGFVSISGNTIHIDPEASDAGTHTITVRATANSLTSEKTFTVRVTVPRDTVSPVITPPPDRTFEATGASTTITDTQLGTATATDNEDPNPVITHDSSGSFGVGVHTITWTATDSSGNSASATQTITIQDTVVPNIALVGNQTIMIDQGSTYEEQSATCTDNIDGTLSVRQQGIVDTRTSGEYTVTYSCTDNSGNSASVSRTITVSQPSTTHVITPADFEHQTSKLYWDCPEVICPSSERSGSEHVQYLKFDISPSTVNDGDTILFTDGTYDLPGPIVLQHANLTIRSDDGSGVTIRSTDNKGLIFRNVGDVSGLEISGLDISSSGTTKPAPARNFAMVFVEHTAGLDDIKILDNTFRGDKQNGIRIGSSDQSSVFTNIEIRDNTFETIPADRTPVHLSNADVTLSANLFERSNYVHHDGAGSLTDLHNFYPGNPDAPVVTPPPNVELEATGPLTAVTPEQLGTATARDDADPSPVISNDSPGSFAVGSHTIIWTAIDSAGNAGIATQTVTIKDTTSPAVTLLGDSRVTVAQGGTYKELSATCIDIVDGSLTITINGAVDTSTLGEYVLEYSCTDTAGNPASVTRTVTVVVSFPQPTDLGIVNEYDLSNGWRMMTIDWTEPSQTSTSGYELTVTSANGTLLSLSQFEIRVSEYRELLSYKMHGTRNQQGDIANILPFHEGMTIHNNMIFVLDNRGDIQIYELNGTHTQTITSLSFAPNFNNGMTIDDSKLWVANRGGPHWDPIVYPVDLTATGVLAAFPPNTGDGFAPHASQSWASGVASHDGILYVTDERSFRVFAYDTAGTYIPSKSFDLPPPGHNRDMKPKGITAEATTGMIYVHDRWGDQIFVYSGADDDGTRRLLFSFDVRGLDSYDTSLAVMPTITSDTIPIPAGSNSTTYYYYAPANEIITHTVQSAVPNSEPPATITTPKN